MPTRNLVLLGGGGGRSHDAQSPKVATFAILELWCCSLAVCLLQPVDLLCVVALDTIGYLVKQQHWYDPIEGGVSCTLFAKYHNSLHMRCQDLASLHADRRLAWFLMSAKETSALGEEETTKRENRTHGSKAQKLCR